MTCPGLPPGYAMRPASFEDAAAVADVIAATELADTGKTNATAEEILSYWQSMNYAEESVVVTATDGSIVAAADIQNRSYVAVTVYGFVHPEHQGRGIGWALVDWGEGWARERMDRAQPGARVVVQHNRHTSNEAARRLFEARGYAAVRATYTMEIELTDPVPEPEWPEGVSVRSLVLGQDELAAHDAHEDAFRDVWGRPRNTLEDLVSRTRVDAFEPDLWFLAEEGDEIVGVCFTRIFGGQGIIDTVGVRRGWRNRGLGLALLQHAFDAFQQRGARSAWLSVDAESITGAPRLYYRAGMHVTGSYILHRKELRAGVDFSQHALE